MPIFGKDKKEGALDSPISGQPGKTPQLKRDSEILNEVKLGIERLSEILSTYLSSFEQRLLTIEKQMGSLESRVSSLEKSKQTSMTSVSQTSATGVGGIRVPTELVEDAIMTEPQIPVKPPEPEVSTIPPATPPKPPKPSQEPTVAVSREELRPPQTPPPRPVPPVEAKPGTPENNIPLSKEVPVTENFFDELRARINKKSIVQPETAAYQPTPIQAVTAETKQISQVQTSEAAGDKTEEDIRMILQRLKESIKRAE
ncbi:MAG: hypothetical protein Q6352_004225 [Candidatus Freyrarchaeum guaymaensis]